jgi:formylglycine-generating enzyme required for sulfatase activity
MEGEHPNTQVRAASNGEPPRGEYGKLRVFVSYSRKDEAFAQELVTGLGIAGFQTYLDKHDVAAGEEWEARLGRLIDTADTVVFVISPDAVASERCSWEVERTSKLKKRLLPVVWRPVPEAEVPPRLKRLNYIFFDKSHSFAPSLAALATALRTDLDWIREHTRLGEAALRWQDRGRSDALLLRGEELLAAKTWLKIQPRYAPEPPLLTHEYINASDQAEDVRLSAQRRQLAEIAAAQQEREKALARETEALEQARAAVRNTQRAQKGIGVLLAVVFVGMLGVMNQTFVIRQVNWFWTMRPYMMANFRPHVLSTLAERALGPGQEFRECATDCPTMVVVAAGSFMMGSPDTERGRAPNEGPRQQIEIASQFAVSKYPVTFSEWDACTAVGGCAKIDDSGFGRGPKPVINVTWEEAKQYIEWLSQMTGQNYRMLTEAEFEFAARAGTATAFPWGDDILAGKAYCAGCGNRLANNKGTAPVGQFSPNAFGLFDIHGNVAQWVEDCYFKSLDGIPSNGRARTANDCTRHVVRGAGWDSGAARIRSAARDLGTIPHRDYNIGFRVARTLQTSAP